MIYVNMYAAKSLKQVTQGPQQSAKHLNSLTF